MDQTLIIIITKFLLSVFEGQNDVGRLPRRPGDLVRRPVLSRPHDGPVHAVPRRDDVPDAQELLVQGGCEGGGSQERALPHAAKAQVSFPHNHVTRWNMDRILIIPRTFVTILNPLHFFKKYSSLLGEMKACK